MTKIKKADGKLPGDLIESTNSTNTCSCNIESTFLVLVFSRMIYPTFYLKIEHLQVNIAL